MHGTWREQRGSITAVWVAIFASFCLLGIAVLEREWVNYQMRLVEQTADLAAEASAYSHEVWVTLEADLTKVVQVQNGCEPSPDPDQPTPEPGDPDCVPSYIDVTYYDTRRYRGLYQDVEGTLWQPYIGCGVDGWYCNKVEVVLVDFQFLQTSDELAERTFRDNWRDRSANHLLYVGVMQQRSAAKEMGWGRVVVEPRYSLRPFFGMLPLEQTLITPGSSVVRIKAPELKL